jgi:hypothetical protein
MLFSLIAAIKNNPETGYRQGGVEIKTDSRI